MYFKHPKYMTHQISTKTYAKNLILKKSKILRFPGTTVPESTDSPKCQKRRFRKNLNLKFLPHPPLEGGTKNMKFSKIGHRA